MFSSWYPWHILGVFLVSLPILLTLAGYACIVAHPTNIHNNTLNLDFLRNNNIRLDVEFFDYYYTFLILASVVHFCNFTQLNSTAKNLVAIASIVIFVSLTFVEQCQLSNLEYVTKIFISKFIKDNVFLESDDILKDVSMCCEQLGDIIKNLTVYNAHTYYEMGDLFFDAVLQNGTHFSYFVTNEGFQFFEVFASAIASYPTTYETEFLHAIAPYVYYDFQELVLNVIIMIILITLLNRELETNYRGSYFFNVESNKDKIHVQHLKNQADMLLENIIPKHVSVELKNRAKYCENHTDVGIIFASIVNFNKLYDETYSGGKEYLRYLNELISDFDELLRNFNQVEKIKTIGSTFMAASGLNPELRKASKHPHEHLFQLIDFAKEMYRVVDDFNGDLLGFNLVLRVGFNIGEVTAGVIGSSKLLYDIWGDTVNVASRMDSTGVDGRLQVPCSCLKYLSDRYEFEARGSVYVKGKGDINVHLLKN